jgi:protein-S-isoprenylcysteine O-methyltransferase Ste14
MIKAAYLIFAVLAYAIFFATFLYLVGFVGDLPWLAKTVDRGVTRDLFTALLGDAALIALFGLQHSVMARAGFKQAWTRIVPRPLERSVYVLAASLVLMVLFAGWSPIAGDVWRVEGGFGEGVLWTLFACGWLIVLLSTFLLNHFELFGLQQVYFHARGRAAAPPRMRLPLFYKIVRHPLYSGFFIAFWATPRMTWGHLLLAAGMSAYMLVAIRLEERDLVGVFGGEYEDYRRSVGMLTPRMRRRSS